jgi:hypothetical protein
MAIHVMSAFYASPNKGVDVTQACINLVDGGATQLTVLPGDLGIPDPDFGVPKGFTIEYSVGGQAKIKGGVDGNTIVLN